MKRFLKRLIIRTLQAIRRVLDPIVHFQEVSILAYHSIDDSSEPTSVERAIFESHIAYLEEQKYHFADIHSIVGYIRGEITLPRRTVALTFDDNYKSWRSNVIPVLHDHDIPAIFFLTESGADVGNELEQMSDGETSELCSLPLITCGHHSRTHRMLERLNPSELARELKDPRQSGYFAYPGGHRSNAVVDAVKRCGFAAAFSISPGLVHRGDDRFDIKRNVITASTSRTEFASVVTVVVDWYVLITRLIRRAISLKYNQHKQ